MSPRITGCVLIAGFDPDVEVFRRARVTVNADRIGADDEKSALSVRERAQ
jgi:hypothetical protein